MPTPGDANHGSVFTPVTTGGRGDQAKRRRSDLPDPPTVSNLDLTGLIDLGNEASYRRWSMGPSVDWNETPEQQREREERAEEERRKIEEERAQKQEEFRSALNDALANAYELGANAAVARAERTAWNARSVALYLLVFAVVAMPAIAILAGISPQDFGAYVAPITGIAGTVVGYWFSRSTG